MRIVRNIILGLIIPILIFVAWYLVTAYTDVPPAILPTPAAVWQAFRASLASGKLLRELGISLLRVMEGFLLAAALGGAAGTLMGMSPPVRRLFGPLLTAVRQIPMIAWMPLVVLWCGIGESSKVTMIVIAAFFPILLNTLSGIAETPSGYLEVARLHGLNRFQTFRKVYLPSALPQILSGLKVGLAISWMSLIAAELLAGTSGIGYMMSYAKSLMRSDLVMVCMAVIGLTGFILDRLLTLLFRLATPWRGGGEGAV